MINDGMLAPIIANVRFINTRHSSIKENKRSSNNNTSLILNSLFVMVIYMNNIGKRISITKKLNSHANQAINSDKPAIKAMFIFLFEGGA